MRREARGAGCATRPGRFKSAPPHQAGVFGELAPAHHHSQGVKPPALPPSFLRGRAAP